MDNINKKNPVLEEQEKIVESILFMMGESVSVDTLALAIYSDEKTAREAAERLVKKYEEEYSDRGMKIIRLNGKYQMVANNIYFKNLIQVASHPKKPVITEAVLETLSIIAYKQPVTKPEIEDIRGVKSDFAVNRLIEYGLIEEKGRLDAPGRPIIFGTTEEFLLRFGLESTADLPKLDPKRMEEIVKEVEKEVSMDVKEPYVVNDNDLNKVKENVDENLNEDNNNFLENNESKESVTENFNQSVVDTKSATDDNNKQDDLEDYIHDEILIELDKNDKQVIDENKSNNQTSKSTINIELDDERVNNNIIRKNDYKNDHINEESIPYINTNIDAKSIDNYGYFDKVYRLNSEEKGYKEGCKKEKTSFIKLVLDFFKNLIRKIINFFKKK